MSRNAGDRPAGGVWPSVTDYHEAVQNLHVSMSDDELRGGHAVLGDNGLPLLYAGGCADVYKVACEATGQTWAVKFFKREVRGLRERYREIGQHLAQARLPFMVDFYYLEEGVRIAGRWYPLVKLRWVQGLTLNEFVAQAVHQPRRLEQLFQLWIKLADRLRAARIAHADLQHGNVLLVPRGDQGELLLKLIDYDGMWVPSLARWPAAEVGHRHYQHPRRSKTQAYDADVDHFSHLVICGALRCLSVGGSTLWERFDNGDNLLFQEADFANPGDSPLFRELWTLRDPAAHALVGRLALEAVGELAHVPPLVELFADGRVRPLSDEEQRAAQAIFSPPRRIPSTTVTNVANGAETPNIRPCSTAHATPTDTQIPDRRAVRRVRFLAVGAWALVLLILIAGLFLRSLLRQQPSPTIVANDDQSIPQAPHQGESIPPVAEAMSEEPSGSTLPATESTGQETAQSTPSPSGNGNSKADATPNDIPPNNPAGAAETGASEPASPRNVEPPSLAMVPFDQDAAKQHQRAWASHVGQPVEKEFSLPAGQTLLMVLIPAGEFVRTDDSGTQFRVRLSQPYYMSKYEVTFEQWHAVTGMNAANRARRGHPVTKVSWNDIEAFSTQLTACAVPRGMTFQLPTEAQWEFACRAGASTTYSFGNEKSELKHHAWFSNGPSVTHPVGQLKPNAFDLYDMHGNVWEWCRDWYATDYYSQAPQESPENTQPAEKRALRGGSWSSTASACAVSYRASGAPDLQNTKFGFRVLATLP